MNPQEMSWKARINRYAAEHNLAPQVVLQNIMMQRFLRRLASSAYREHFVLKGGVLVAAMVGLEYRSTMDIDTTLRHYPMSKETMTRAIQEMIAIDAQDDTVFRLVRITDIRQDDEYGGLRVSMLAQCGHLSVPFSIDVSTGDAITPHPVEMTLPAFLDTYTPVCLLCYNVETVLAEKLETIIRRGILSTRPRDFYDVYILMSMYQVDMAVLHQALRRTAKHRGSLSEIAHSREIFSFIRGSAALQHHWEKYRQNFPYARPIDYSALMETLGGVLERLGLH